MHLVRETDAPTAETVLFHLTLFGEFCETPDVGVPDVAVAFECLRDAVDELSRMADALSLSPEASAPVRTALHQAEATFREEMPDHFVRTSASRGFSALRDLVCYPATPDRCSDRERRSIALADAERFGKTLTAFLVTLNAEAARRGRGAQRTLRTREPQYPGLT